MNYNHDYHYKLTPSYYRIHKLQRLFWGHLVQQVACLPFFLTKSKPLHVAGHKSRGKHTGLMQGRFSQNAHSQREKRYNSHLESFAMQSNGDRFLVVPGHVIKRTWRVCIRHGHLTIQYIQDHTQWLNQMVNVITDGPNIAFNIVYKRIQCWGQVMKSDGMTPHQVQ